MQPAYIWIPDHVGHDRKNLDGSNLEKMLHHVVSCEQQNREHISLNDINIMVKKGDSLI